MEKGKNKQKQGFTIIEVVLVLAIAGLIFLMTFLALPALNRTQRDARRRDDISNFLRKLKEYQTNNRGALPGGDADLVTNETGGNSQSWGGFYREYLGENFQDPNGQPYKLTVQSCGETNLGANCTSILDDSTPFPNDFRIMIFRSATCDGGVAEQSSNPRKIAAQYKLEGGGVYCANT